MTPQQESTEYQGYWWLPEFPDRRVAGTLTGIKTGSIELSLLGQLKERNVALGVKSVTYSTILGIVSKKLISLSNCHIIGSEFSFLGFTTEKLSVSTAFIGAHILDTQEAKFNNIILKFDHFDEWLCIPFIGTEDVRDDSGSLLEYNFSYRIPNSIKIELEELNMSIDYGAEAKGTFLGMIHSRNIELKQFGFITLQSHEEMTLDKWNHQLINPWQGFLTLATGEPIHLQRLEILEGNKKIEVIFSKSREEASKNIRDVDMLFTLRDINDKFGNFIKSWLSVSQRFDSVCNLFISTKYTSSLYLENQFLPIVQALESYHRISERFSNNIVEEQEYEIIKQRLIDSLYDEHKKGFKDKFQYLNEVGLRKRLKDIFDLTQEVVNPLVSSKKDFVNSICNTRNYLTHYDKKIRPQVLQGRDLFWATRILGYMLQACLLREIGFSNEETGSLFRRNQEYMYAEGYIREHYFKKDKKVNVNHTPEDKSESI